MRHFALIAALTLTFATLPRMAVADSPSSECEAAVMKIAGSYAGCLSAARSQHIRSGNVRRLGEKTKRCFERFSRRFERRQDSGGTESCTSVPASQVALQVLSMTRKVAQNAAGEASPRDYIMLQDADRVSFAVDDEVSESCPSGALWSGTMTLLDPATTTFFSSDRPSPVTFAKSTEQFVTDFDTTFSETGGENPRAMVSWDAETASPRSFALELLPSPEYSATDPSLTYGVCGLAKHDPNTLEILPEGEQAQPAEEPSAASRITLLIQQASQPQLQDGGTSCTCMGGSKYTPPYDGCKKAGYECCKNCKLKHDVWCQAFGGKTGHYSCQTK